jgi:hypothetical protein
MLKRIKFGHADWLLLVLFSGIAALIALADRAPIAHESISEDIKVVENFIYYWQGVVYRFFPGPYVYRVLVPYLLLGLNKLTSLDLLTLDFLLKVLFLIGCQYVLLFYMSNFLSRMEALLGVLLFDAVMGYSLSFIHGPSVIETIDLVNFLMLGLGLIAIYKKDTAGLSLVLFIGLLNRETPLLLLPVVFLQEWFAEKNWRRALSVSAFALLIFAGVRLLIPSWAAGTWFNLDGLQANIPLLSSAPTREAVVGNIRLAVMAGPFILISLYRFNEHQLFLRIAAAMTPVLIAAHYLTARVIEARLWMPLFLLLIPLTINNLVKSMNK